MGKIRFLVGGVGGQGSFLAEAAELFGQFEVVGFLDDSMSAGESVLGKPVLGPSTSVAKHTKASHSSYCGIR